MAVEIDISKIKKCIDLVADGQAYVVSAYETNNAMNREDFPSCGFEITFAPTKNYDPFGCKSSGSPKDEFPRKAIMVNPHEAPLEYGGDHLGREIEVVEYLPDENCYVVRFDWGLGVLDDSMIDFGLHEVRTKNKQHRESVKRWFMENRWNDVDRALDAFFERFALGPKE